MIYIAAALMDISHG